MTNGKPVSSFSMGISSVSRTGSGIRDPGSEGSSRPRVRPFRSIASSRVNSPLRVRLSASSVAPVPSTGVFVIANGREGETYGAELWGDFELTDSWRLKAGYAILHEDLRFAPGSIATSEANDATHRFLLRSSMDLTPKFELDWTLSYVSALPDPTVPAYTAVDLRLGWKPSKQLEVSLIGQNLLDKRHPEFGPANIRSEIERSVLVKAACRF